MFAFDALRMRNPSAGGGGSAPYGTHAYWMLEIDSNNGNSTTTGLTELKFYDGGGSPIAASGGTAFSSGSGSDSNPVSNLFDGNNSSAWQRSSATNTKCGYHFASAVGVGSIDLISNLAVTQDPVKCRLRYSDDGVTYTTAFEIWEPSWASGTSTRTWPQDTAGGKYKAYRWHVTANNGDRFYYMAEAELRTSHGGSDITGTGVAFSSDNSTTGSTPDQLFDNNSGSSFAWDTAQTPAQIPGDVGYYLPTTAAVNEYVLTQNSATTRSWNSWTLQGSNDGVSWTTVDTQSGITWSTTPQTKTFSF